MTRKEIETQYKVENGIIVSPGKFEREPVYSPYFYEISLSSGNLGKNGEVVNTIEIIDEMVHEFPELCGWDFAIIQETEHGFVFCHLENIDEDGAICKISTTQNQFDNMCTEFHGLRTEGVECEPAHDDVFESQLYGSDEHEHDYQVVDFSAENGSETVQCLSCGRVETYYM